MSTGSFAIFIKLFDGLLLNYLKPLCSENGSLVRWIFVNIYGHYINYVFTLFGFLCFVIRSQKSSPRRESWHISPIFSSSSFIVPGLCLSLWSHYIAQADSECVARILIGPNNNNPETDIRVIVKDQRSKGVIHERDFKTTKSSN